MGLSAYLYRYEHLAKTLTKEDKYERGCTKIWNDITGGRDSHQLSTDEQDRYHEQCAELATHLGLDKYGEAEPPEKEAIQLDSRLHPNHLFKIGYFRSSYNSSGINQILHNTTGKDLFHIFQPGEEYVFVPSWEDANVLAKQVRAQFKQHVRDCGTYQVFELSDRFGLKRLWPEAAKSERQALQVFLQEKQRYEEGKRESRSQFEAYSNRGGHFYMSEPLPVVALIEGATTHWQTSTPIPCLYVVHHNPDGFDWYIQALDIVVETIEYVLSQDDPTKYALHWSG